MTGLSHLFSKKDLELLSNYHSLIEKDLEQCRLDYLNDYPYIREPLDYIFKAPAKRLRALLILVFGEIFGAKTEQLLVLVRAVELMHASTLIHDDLPCLDNDDYRRGIPSLHKVFGEGEALLLGNIIFSLALKQISQLNLDSYLNIGDISRDISCSGLKNRNSLSQYFIETYIKINIGQILDISRDAEKGKIDQSDYNIRLTQVIFKYLKEINLDQKDYIEHLIAKNCYKTGALFSFSILSPLFLLENKDSTWSSLLEEIGYIYGSLFQIVDDLLAMIDPKLVGKDINTDQINKTPTFSQIVGVDDSIRIINKFKEVIFNKIDILADQLKNDQQKVDEAHISLAKYLILLPILRLPTDLLNNKI